MTRDLVLLIVGAAIGPAAVLAWRKMKSIERRVRWSRRISRDRRLGPAAVEWFCANNLSDNLYRPRVVNQRQPVAMLQDPESDMIGVVHPSADLFVVLGSRKRREFVVDERAVERRRKAGAELWDGSLLYATELAAAPDGRSLITAGVCNFYSYVTAADRIQAALLDPTQSRHRDFLLGNLSTVAGVASASHPVGIAAATTCVFETDDGPRLLLTKRAEEVVNALGNYCVIPTFGFESHVVDGAQSAYGAVFYNFAKEFLEEVYGQEDLIRAASSESLDPDAIFESKKARALLSQFSSGAAELRVLGLGVELTDGTFTLALMAHFRSADFYREVRSRAHAGWEVQRIADARPIAFLDPGGDEVMRASMTDRMSATSLFSLDLTLQHLARSSANVP